MFKFARQTMTVAVAAVCSVIAFGGMVVPAPANAAEGAAHYRAQLAAPAADPRPIANGTVWRCGGASCTAPESGSRPVIVCARLAKTVGAVTAFEVAGKPLDAEAVARCNGK